VRCIEVRTTQQPSYSYFVSVALLVEQGQGALDAHLAWSPVADAVGEWWQWDLGVVQMVKGVITQGKGAQGQCVTLFFFFFFFFFLLFLFF
jgi:hypothetical protein